MVLGVSYWGVRGRGAWCVSVPRGGATCARGAGRYAVRASGRACDAVMRWGGGLGWERGEGVLCVLVWGSMGLFF